VICTGGHAAAAGEDAIIGVTWTCWLWQFTWSTSEQIGSRRLHI